MKLNRFLRRLYGLIVICLFNNIMTFSYKDINNSVKEKNGLVRALTLLDKAITYITVFLYVFLLGYTFFIVKDGYTIFYRSLLVPAASFILVSAFRKVFNAPRPYEVYGFKPALSKDTRGKSFPSRHVFSIIMVAMAWLQVSTALGLLLLVLGIVLAAVRVLGGVHFIGDVIAGAAIALIVGDICFFILGKGMGLLVWPFL